MNLLIYISKTKEKRYLLGIQISYDIKNRVVENNLSKQLRTHVPTSCCIRQNAVAFLAVADPKFFFTGVIN